MCVHRKRSEYRVSNQSCSLVSVIRDRILKEQICDSNLLRSRKDFAGRAGPRRDQANEELLIHIGADAARSCAVAERWSTADPETACDLVRTRRTPDQSEGYRLRFHLGKAQAGFHRSVS